MENKDNDMKKQILKNSQVLLFVASGMFLSATGYASPPDSNRAPLPQTPSVTASGPAYVIFDNTAGLNSAAIMSNMATGRDNECSRNNVLIDNSCNGFSLGNNDVQVIQNDGTGNLVNMIGVDNSNSTSYENKGTEKQTYYFSPGQHLFDIDKFRNVANDMTALQTNQQLGTYGTITFQQFLVNIATGRTMNGIVRVKVPLVDIMAQTQAYEGMEGSPQSRYAMCGETPTAACSLCGPGPETALEAGRTICGITLPENAQVRVNGSLMFDWVDCQTDQPVAISEFPSNPSEISFAISIPLNINPANLDAHGQTMQSITQIQSISGSNQCPQGASPCDVTLNTTIDFSLVPQESKDMYEFKIGTPLTAAVFGRLSKSDQYHLLFPSGYANGWSSAFSALGITPATWNDWGFNVTASGNAITANDIRKDSFADIPALMYTGGTINIKHNTNISGLIYAPQAIEISQNGVTKNNCAAQVIGGDDDNTLNAHGNDDDTVIASCNGITQQGDDGDGNASDDDPTVVAINTRTFTPSYQYINGAIIVRDGFYFEATKPGGITLISNNPDSYSNTRLKNGTGIRKNFKPYRDVAINNTTGDGTAGAGGNQSPENNQDNSILTGKNGVAQVVAANQGPQWVEIRPQ